jgi:hypothetical protein
MEVNMVRRLAVSVILIPIAAAAWPGVFQAQQPANPKVDSAVATAAGGLVERGATGILRALAGLAEKGKKAA